jgi:ubiquinone/menaquinone biosynthesis C-methylase UbiE
VTGSQATILEGDGCPVEQDYTRQARAYDQSRYLNRKARFTSRFETELLREAILTFASRRRLLVDVACGTGHFTIGVHDLFDQVVGVDLTRAMLEKAQVRLNGVAGSRVGLIQGSATALPLRENFADVVMSTRFLHLFPRSTHPSLVEHLLRILRPGGTLILEHDWFYGVIRRAQKKYWSTYHASEMPAGRGTRLARIGVLAPGLPTVARWSPGFATRLGRLFRGFPLNRLSTRVIVVYRKP